LESLKRFRFQMIFLSGWGRKRLVPNVACNENGGTSLQWKWQQWKVVDTPNMPA